MQRCIEEWRSLERKNVKEVTNIMINAVERIQKVNIVLSTQQLMIMNGVESTDSQVKLFSVKRGRD